MRNKTLLFAAGLILGFLLNHFGCKKVERHTNYLPGKTDTTWVVKERVVNHIPKPKIIYVPKIVAGETRIEYVKQFIPPELIHDTLLVEAAAKMPELEYADTLIGDGYRMSYAIQTVGFLKKFEHQITVPKMVIERTDWAIEYGAGIRYEPKGPLTRGCVLPSASLGLQYKSVGISVDADLRGAGVRAKWIQKF